MKQNYLQQMLRSDRDYRRAFVFAVAVPFLCAAAAAVVLWGQNALRIFFHPCRIREVTGWLCVSCGATHSTLALITGNFVAAVYYNPLYVAFLGWLFYLYIRLVMSLFLRPYRKFELRVGWRWAVSVLLVVVLFVIIRNQPFYRSIFY